jgi:phytoene dehydrogenase-like protein
MKRYDALIIGGGHNGLVCGFYLARAGLKVRVLERRDVVGGAAVTEEFHPGFRNSTASYTVSLLRPKVIADMGLHDRGLRIIERELSNFIPFEDDYLKLGGGMARTQAEFARFNRADAEAYPAYDAALDKVAQVLRDLTLLTPPNAGGGLAALAAGARQGWPIAKLNIETQRDLLDIFVKSARDFLDGWFEDDRIKAAFAFDAVVGNYRKAPGATRSAAWARSPRRWRVPAAMRGLRSALERRLNRCWSTEAGRPACGSRAVRRSPQRLSRPTSAPPCSTAAWSIRAICRPISAGG